MPDIDAAIWKKYEDQGVLVYGIHPNESPQQLEAFLEQTGISFPVLADVNSKNQFAFPPGVGYPYPRDVVIGKDLTVRSIKNSFNVPEMEGLIQQLLLEPDP